MKKFITFSLFIFITIVAGVMVVGLISPNNKNNQPTNNFVSGISSSTSGTNLILSMAELTKHNSSQSCWLLISGKIYDVTSFLYQHPGNVGTILPSCGLDATVAFDTRGGTGSHSSSAFAMLTAYYIGDLNQTVR